MISESWFEPLRVWAEQSVAQYNQVIGSCLVFFFAACIFYFYEWIYLWRADERIKVIRYASYYWMFGAVVFCDLLFSKTYLWHIFFLLKYGIVLTVGALYIVIRKIRDAA